MNLFWFRKILFLSSSLPHRNDRRGRARRRKRPSKFQQKILQKKSFFFLFHLFFFFFCAFWKHIFLHKALRGNARTRIVPKTTPNLSPKRFNLFIPRPEYFMFLGSPKNCGEGIRFETGLYCLKIQRKVFQDTFQSDEVMAGLEWERKTTSVHLSS